MSAYVIKAREWFVGDVCRWSCRLEGARRFDTRREAEAHIKDNRDLRAARHALTIKEVQR